MASRRTLTKDHWIDAATEVMVDSSVEHVRIETLARDLDVSRGSFYWHFQNRDELLNGVLEKWTQYATLGVHERLYQREPLASRRLLLVLRLPLRSPRSQRAADLELAILGWARRSRIAEQAVASVDELRISHLTSLFEELGLSAAAAQVRAHTTYAFVRYIAQRRDMDAKERLDLTTTLHAMLLEGCSSSASPAPVMKATPVR
jgi:AcrR family transcriptional regulator